MRLLLGVAAVGALCLGAFWASSRMSADANSDPPMAAGPTTTLEPLPEPGEQKSKLKKAKSRGSTGSRGYQERHVARDMRLARQAVLHPGDVNPIWRPAKISDKQANGCPANDPDLSKVTVTGRARSFFKTGNGATTDSVVKLFANAGQAEFYFNSTTNRIVLRCIRKGIKGWLAKKGLEPRVLEARIVSEPVIGAQTAIYLVSYVITLSDGSDAVYPTEYLTFRVGRAVGGVAYSMVFSPDGSRPCQCEVDEARLVASRLYRT